jgi:hypothetical protein
VRRGRLHEYVRAARGIESGITYARRPLSHMNEVFCW